MNATLRDRPRGARNVALCHDVVEQLEAAVLVIDVSRARLLHANGFARAELGVPLDVLPRELGATILTWLASEPPGLRFQRSHAVTAPGGRIFQARAKLLDPARSHVMLLLLTPHVIREQDVREALRGRFALSQRELQVALGVRAGLANSEIASRLGLTEGTVKNYLSRVFTALGVHSRTHLLAFLRELGTHA